MKIEIKHRFTSDVLFEAEVGSLKLAVEAAVEAKADLGKADLGGADLGGADLGGADLRGAYLRGADLGGADLIDAGQDSRGYRFVAVRQKEGPYLIFAGCHTFTLAEAAAHWGSFDDAEDDVRALCAAKVEMLARAASRLGWNSEAKPVKLGPGQEEEATAQESTE